MKNVMQAEIDNKFKITTGLTFFKEYNKEFLEFRPELRKAWLIRVGEQNNMIALCCVCVRFILFAPLSSVFLTTHSTSRNINSSAISCL
jgi:hypothetical protein